MSSEDPGNGSAADVAASGDASEAVPVDQLGIPMDREPTLDDVRGDSGPHRQLALGCSVAAVALVGGFWLLRALLGG